MEDEDQEEVVVKAVKELKKSPAKSVKSSSGQWRRIYCTTEARSMSPDLTSITKSPPSVMTPNSQDTLVDGKL